MSVFKFPVGLCKDIKAMIRKFWWGNGATKKIHWVKWNSLCSSKSIGGMHSGTFKILIMLCWLSKLGALFITKILLCIRFLVPNIFLMVVSLTHLYIRKVLMHGKVFCKLRR
ncbi:hypothetical protein ACB092_12G174300 [Castanea dentata]